MGSWLIEKKVPIFYSRSTPPSHVQVSYNIFTPTPRYTAMQDDSMTLIFRTIFGNFLERFSAECKTLAEPIVAATVGMYNTILADLRPTPAKSHYTYNLRDLSKVFQVRHFYCTAFNSRQTRFAFVFKECRKTLCSSLTSFNALLVRPAVFWLHKMRGATILSFGNVPRAHNRIP